MPRIERLNFSVTVGAKGNAVFVGVGSAICFLDDVVTLDSRVLALIAEAALPLTRNERFKSNTLGKRHMQSNVIYAAEPAA